MLRSFISMQKKTHSQHSPPFGLVLWVRAFRIGRIYVSVFFWLYTQEMLRSYTHKRSHYFKQRIHTLSAAAAMKQPNTMWWLRFPCCRKERMLRILSVVRKNEYNENDCSTECSLCHSVLSCVALLFIPSVKLIGSLFFVLSYYCVTNTKIVHSRYIFPYTISKHGKAFFQQNIHRWYAQREWETNTTKNKKPNVIMERDGKIRITTVSDKWLA